MEKFENLKRVAINELKKLDTAYANKEEFTPQDCDKIDKMAHGMKCLLTVCAMLEAEEYSMGNEMSGMRGRSPATGRYVSREPAPGYSGWEPPFYSGNNYPYPGPRNW